MKKFFLLLSVIICTSVFATTYTSSQNGNWLSPTTWSPVGIPIPGDIVTINHTVTLDTSLAYTSGSITITPSGSLIQNLPIRDIWVNGINASLTNNGTIDIRYLLLSDGSFSNSGSFNVKSLANYTTVNNTTTGTFNGVDSLFNDGELNNYGTVNIMTFYNDSTINNYSIIKGLTTVVDSMYNAGSFLNDSTATLIVDSCTNLGLLYNAGIVNFNQFTNTGTLDNYNYLSFVDMTNTGLVQNSDSLVGSGDITNLGTFKNFPSIGYLEFNNLLNTKITTSFLQSGGTIKGFGNVTNASFFVNMNWAVMDIDGSFLNSNTTSFDATFINGGSFNIGGSFYNFDSINGHSLGKFVVQDTSYNHTTGKMTGDFDFCDLTPPPTPPFIDINIGSIDPTITYCLGVGIFVNDLENNFSFYPNPTVGLININTNEKVVIEIYNMLGEQILITQQNQVDLTNYENGIYLFKIKDLEGNILSQKRIIKQ